jgi:hypothetical protein
MSTGSVNNQIRFQPVLSEGVTEYTITFTVELSAMGDVYCGTDSNNRDYHNNLAIGTHTITWTGAVHASESFRINIRSEDRTAPITMIVSNIVVVEKQPEPETPAHTCESVCEECDKCTDAECNETACADKCLGHDVVSGTPIEYGNTATALANPGTWYYLGNGTLGTDYGFSEDGAPTYNDGTITSTLNIIPDVANSKYFYLRYQPTDDEVGANGEYKITLTITVSVGTKLRLGTTGNWKYKTLNAGEATTVTYTMTKSDSDTFSIRLHEAITAESFAISVKVDSIKPVN